MILWLNRGASHINDLMHCRYQSCASSFPYTLSSFLYWSFPNLLYLIQTTTEAVQNKLQNYVPTDFDILRFSQDCSSQGQHLCAAAVVQNFIILGGLFEHSSTQEFCTSFHLLNGRAADDRSMVFHKCEGHQDLEHVLLHCNLFYCVPILNVITTCLVSLSHVTCTLRVTLVIMILKPQNQTAHTCQIQSRGCIKRHSNYNTFNVDSNVSSLHSLIPLACAECDNSLPFASSSIPFCYIHFLSTLFHQLVFHPPSLHLAIYFLVYLSALLLPNSYIKLFGGILFSSTLCVCPNKRSLFNLIVSVTVEAVVKASHIRE